MSKYSQLKSLVGSCALIFACCISGNADANDPHELTWYEFGLVDRRDISNGVVVDSTDNVFLGGKSDDIYGAPDNDLESALIAKYSPEGALGWLSYAYNYRHLDHVSGMAIDSSDNIYIGGETYRYQGAEAFLVKFSQSGQLLWERHIGSPNNEFGRDVSVDHNGNAYLSGSTTGDLGVGGDGPGYDGFVTKYSANGNLQWTKQFADSSIDRVNTISADPLGNLFIAGAGSNGEYLGKLAANGDLLWNVSINYSAAPNRRTTVYESTTDVDGNIYLVGTTNGLYVNGQGWLANDAVVAKHDPNGSLVWHTVLQTSETDVATAVDVDQQGNVYISGSTSGDLKGPNAGSSDSFWAKLNSAGTVEWKQQFGLLESDSASGIAVDSTGTVYVTGNRAYNVNGYYAGEFDTYLARFDVIPEPATASLSLMCFLLVIPSVRNRSCRG